MYCEDIVSKVLRFSKLTIVREDDGAYIGEVQHYPGVTAFGRTRELCLEDMTSSLEDIVAFMLSDGPDIMLLD